MFTYFVREIASWTYKIPQTLTPWFLQITRSWWVSSRWLTSASSHPLPTICQDHQKRRGWVNYFSKLIERIKTLCEVINITNLHSILVNTSQNKHMLSRVVIKIDVTNAAECVSGFFCEFSEQSPCVLSRSLLQVRPSSYDIYKSLLWSENALLSTNSTFT